MLVVCDVVAVLVTLVVGLVLVVGVVVVVLGVLVGLLVSVVVAELEGVLVAVLVGVVKGVVVLVLVGVVIGVLVGVVLAVDVCVLVALVVSVDVGVVVGLVTLHPTSSSPHDAASIARLSKRTVVSQFRSSWSSFDGEHDSDSRAVTSLFNVTPRASPANCGSMLKHESPEVKRSTY